MPTRVLVPSGVLGLGFDRDALRAGIERNPDLISIDGGSTDSGPHYLGTGTSKYSRASADGMADAGGRRGERDPPCPDLRRNLRDRRNGRLDGRSHR